MRCYVPLTAFIPFLIACGGASESAARPTTRTVVVERVVVEHGTPDDSPGSSVGDRLEVEYGGSWYPATVEAVLADGRVEISYDGYGQAWNEIVGPARMRPRGESTAPGDPVPTVSRLAKGSSVFVEWGGHWYPGRVRAITPDKRVEIAYDGYDDGWNETVGLARLRVAN